MIRWKFVLPRLVGTLLLALLVYFGAAPALRYAAKTGVKAVTGRNLTIGTIQTSVLQGRATFRNVELAPVDGETGSPLAADEITFDLSTSAALKRRLNIDETAIHGLKIQVDRLDDLVVGGPKSNAPSFDFSPYLNAAGDWLGGSGESLIKDVQAELKSPALVKELSERWPAEWKSLQNEAESIANEAKTLKTRAEELKQNPVRGLAELEDTLQRAFALRQRGVALKDRAQRLLASAKEDRGLVEAARSHDILYLKENFGSWQAVDKEKLAGYLVGDSLATYAAEGLKYVTILRKLAPYLQNTAKPQRMADKCVNFPVFPPKPNFLLSKLLIDGELQHRERTLPFSGVLEGVTTQPRVLGRPTQFRLVSNDHAFPGEIVGEIDQTTDHPRESFTVRLPQLATPAMTLGNAEQFAVAVNSGVSQIEARFLFVDDQLRGEIHLSQQHAEMAPLVAARLGGERLAAPLRTVLSQVDGLSLATYLAGRVEKPEIRLATNLDNVLSQGIQTAVATEIEKAKAMAAQKIQTELANGLAKLDNLVIEEQRQLQEKLGLGEQELALIAQLAQGRVGGQVSQLASKLQAQLPPGVKNQFDRGGKHPLSTPAAQSLQGALRGLVR